MGFLGLVLGISIDRWNMNDTTQLMDMDTTNWEARIGMGKGIWLGSFICLISCDEM